MRLAPVLIVCAVWLCAAIVPAHAAADRLTVFAASSLADVMAEIETAWEAETGGNLVVALAGTSTLARQIRSGAPADVFVSANAAWMDAVVADGRIDPATRADIATNRIVLAAPAASLARPVVADDLAERLRGARLAMALVDAVPAGIYGKAALTHMGVWDALAPRVAQTASSRAALALVANAAVPYGIVYATDALAEPRVRTLAVFPADSHPQVRYPAAALAAAGPEAAAFVAYLRGPRSQAILANHGFGQPPG